MAAPASEAEETRAVVDAGPQRMVIMAYELFRVASDDVERRISEQFKRNGEKIRLRPWELPSGLKAYAFFPESATRDEVANLVMGVYLIRSDQTIQQVAIYVNPEGAQASAKASILARAICATLAEGKRSLNQASGERELMAVSPQKSMLVTVPNGYVTTRQDGPDFSVYHIRKLVMFGEEAMSIGVYLGDYPSGQTGYTRRETGRLFEREIEWSEGVGQRERRVIDRRRCYCSSRVSRPALIRGCLSARGRCCGYAGAQDNGGDTSDWSPQKAVKDSNDGEQPNVQQESPKSLAETTIQPACQADFAN